MSRPGSEKLMRSLLTTGLLAALPASALAQAAMTPAQLDNEWRVHVENQKLALAVAQDNAHTAAALNAHAVAAYWVQLWFSIALTLFVLGMVAVAIWFSYLQFKSDQAARRAAAAQNAEPLTSIKISSSGLEMSSSVIGLFVLLAAMAFFYLYVDKVYEIHTAAAPPAPAAAAK
jgi:putative effector of murein hydrolase LrgA (UPF0299 family)